LKVENIEPSGKIINAPVFDGTIAKMKDVKSDGNSAGKDLGPGSEEVSASREDELECITEEINKNILVFDRRIQFETYKDTNRIYVKVVDAETGKVIREIPPEQMLKLAQNLKEMIGIIFDEKR